MDIEVTKFLAEISIELESYCDYIDWRYIGDKYNVNDLLEFDGVNFEPIYIDGIVESIYEMGKSTFKEFIYFISYRYGINNLKDLLEENDFIFNDVDTLDFNDIHDVHNDSLKMFISFSNENEEIALEIQKFFEMGNIDCFLSKNKLDPSDEYKQEIYNRIIISDIFIYVLSKESHSSCWCDQEMGMAYLKYKHGNAKIFIVCIDDGFFPYGFLSGIQAEFYKNQNYLYKISEKIKKDFDFDVINNIKGYHKDSIDSKIKKLFVAESFIEARSILSFLKVHVDLLSKSHIDSIIEASMTNDQIYKCDTCKPYLKEILDKHKDMIDNNKYKEIFKKIY